MPNRRQDEKASEMMVLYSQGFSLSEIGRAFGVSRQSVYKMLARTRGIQLRELKRLPFIEYGGNRYTLRENGYYARTNDDRSYLHRDIWEANFGEIPFGYEVHHKDGNKENNDPSNFECLESSEHGRKHGFGGNQYTGSLGTRPIK